MGNMGCSSKENRGDLVVERGKSMLIYIMRIHPQIKQGNKEVVDFWKIIETSVGRRFGKTRLCIRIGKQCREKSWQIERRPLSYEWVEIY